MKVKLSSYLRKAHRFALLRAETFKFYPTQMDKVSSKVGLFLCFSYPLQYLFL